MAIPESIKKLANDIRTKIYGKEVREALAEGIEEAGDLADKANTKSENAVYQVNNIQAQVNQLVVEGDSSVEAAQARVDAERKSYPTLKARLDAKETEFSSHLADNTNKIRILNDALALKADKTYVDTVTQAIASGSPRGLFNTLSDLEGAYPTGAEGIYVVTEDGNWYYWNGTQWKAGGVYQAVKIADRSVGVSKLSFVKMSTNLHNPDTDVKGYSISITDGSLSPSDIYATTDFIEIEPSTTYSYYGFNGIAYYDENKGFIQKLGPMTSYYDGVTFTSPTNARYVRCQYQTNNKYTNYLRRVNKGNQVLDYEEYRPPSLDVTVEKYKRKSVKDLDIADGAVTPKKTNFMRRSTNLYNKALDVEGYSISDDGSLNQSESYNTTDFIEVDPSEEYTFYGFLAVAFYDENKNFISRTPPQTSNYDGITLKTPSKCRFVRAHYQNATTYERRVNEGSAVLPHEEWRKPELSGVVATEYKEGSVSTKHTDFIQESTNLFNPDAVIRRYNISSTDGTLFYSQNYCTTDWIKVDELTTYYYYGMTNVAYYDKDKNFIRREYLTLGGTTRITPKGTAYIRCGFQPFTTSYPERRINKGAELPYEPYYKKFDKNLGLGVLNKVIERDQDNVMFDIPIDGVFDFTGTLDEDYATTWANKTTSDVYALFDDLMEQYPWYITREFLGQEYTGLPIYAYHFTPALPQATITPKIPKIFINAAIHGAEKASTLTTYLFVKEMCQNWESSPLLEALRHNVNFIIIPIANPWAWENNSRVNSRGVDINRNFPYDWVQGTEGDDRYGGPEPLSELETQYIKSIFDNHPDIDIVYDFHNFFNTGNSDYFLWISAFTGQYMQHVGQNLISRMTRKWKREYTFIPDDWFVGFANYSPHGKLKTYAASLGIKLTSTFEIRWKWLQETGSVPYNQTMCKTGVEALVNLLLISLRELAR